VATRSALRSARAPNGCTFALMTPNPTPFERWAALRALVDRYMFWFLCGWLGGPDLYVQRHGHPRLRARHLPYAIGIAERDQWLACMVQAMQERAVDPALAERLAASFYGTADWMRNKGG
jgi:truncated hemoglobin YjbI